MNNSNELKRRVKQRLLIWSSLYTIIIVLLFLVFKYSLSQSTYYGYELFYPFYRWVNHNRFLAIVMALFFGYVLISIFLFKNLIGYIDEITAVVDEINMDDNSPITLSNELRGLGERMTRTKFNIRENARLAREAEKRKNDLIVYLAHDLKTPLTSIIGYLTILKDEDNLSKEFQQKYLNICYDKSTRLEDLINEFFEITRYNLKDMDLEISRVDFSLMMKQIISEFMPFLREKNLKINSEIEDSIELKIDANKIERVIDNIIRNAINYSSLDGIIDILVKQDYDFVNIIVKNEGLTIPASKIDHIFDEFFRMDSSRSSQTGGAGLGLAIAKSIVLAHKGTIDARSEDGFVEMQVNLPL